MEEAPLTSPELIELEPYIYQVGGHSFMLSLDEATVCKPLIQRELQFYQTMPDAVRKFIPRFYGIIQVTTVEKEDGYVSFLAKPSPAYASPSAARELRLKLKRTGSIELIKCPNKFKDDQLDESVGSELEGLNPWVLKCHRDNINNLIESCNHVSNSSSFRDFIILENLTLSYSLPCILDLKMGTRQYGDAASLAKKQSKMFKVVSTTSAKLGLRVGGMQVYQVPSKHFLCRNKFYGRKLTISGFQQALIQFLHNGIRFRSDVLPVLIKRLEELANVVGRQEAIRFYTTSLLLLYEGEDLDSELVSDEQQIDKCFKYVERQDSFRQLKLPVNDLLRKTSSAESLTSYADAVPIDEINKVTLQHRRSSTNLDAAMSNVSSENNSNTSSNSTIFEDCVSENSRRNSNKNYLQHFNRSRTFSNKSETGSLSYNEPKVDVRMIDFAHCSYKSLDDPVMYSGPDRGFLFGLDKLVNMLKAIENDYG